MISPSVPVFSVSRLQRVRAVLQDFPGRFFRLQRPRKFLPFQAVEEVESRQEAVIPLIPVLAYKYSYGIAFKLYNISVGHRVYSSR